MGFNHQSASISCALGEAFHTGRTLLLPSKICLFALHTERWKGGVGGPGEKCEPIGELFDIESLSKLVPIRLFDADEADDTAARRAAGNPSTVVSVDRASSSQMVRRKQPCGPAARLVRRRVDTFWFQQCARRHTDYFALAAELNRLVGAPPGASKPLNIILRSGLFFSRSIKAAATAIRVAIGGAYASLHVRRSDKLVGRAYERVVNGVRVKVPAACSEEDCRTRDRLTRPEAIGKTLSLWIPYGSRVYIGSTEPPSFFEPLRSQYRLHFAEDFGPQLANITNNYALYAVETLLFFGSQASVESLGFQSAWFVDACFPATSMRTRRGSARLAALGVANASSQQHGPHDRGLFASAVDIQCRDQSGILINGVLYGPACASNAPCGRDMYLAPAPKPCGRPRLPERLMVPRNATAGRSVAASSRTAGLSMTRRCASLAQHVIKPNKANKHGGRLGGGGGGGGGGGKLPRLTSLKPGPGAKSKAKGLGLGRGGATSSRSSLFGSTPG
jgi:hypothetical protein